ncbi:Fc.00g058770.m01.CDS01 [Cosmosporella sp. VM-42]
MNITRSLEWFCFEALESRLAGRLNTVSFFDIDLRYILGTFFSALDGDEVGCDELDRKLLNLLSSLDEIVNDDLVEHSVASALEGHLDDEEERPYDCSKLEKLGYRFPRLRALIELLDVSDDKFQLVSDRGAALFILPRGEIGFRAIERVYDWKLVLQGITDVAAEILSLPSTPLGDDEPQRDEDRYERQDEPFSGNAGVVVDSIFKEFQRGDCVLICSCLVARLNMDGKKLSVDHLGEPSFPAGHPILLSFAKLLLEIKSGEIIDLEIRALNQDNLMSWARLCSYVATLEINGGSFDYIQAVKECLYLHLQLPKFMVDELHTSVAEALKKGIHEHIILNLEHELRPEGLKRKRRESLTEEPTSRKEASFHSGRSISLKCWLDNLKGISAEVDSKRNKHGVTARVRVAILDTGLSPGMAFFQDEDDGPRRLNQITRWRDFVDPTNLSLMADDFGHGTLMARLVAECAPFAEIMVARVARSTKELIKCQKNVAEVSVSPILTSKKSRQASLTSSFSLTFTIQAILWAGQNGADLISMSFGFPQGNTHIDQAIHQVATGGRSLVFLASAGNSPHENEGYPARHPAVISIYATNRYGTFTESNSRRPEVGTDFLGTFGDDIPPNIYHEFEQQYPRVCQPGSSVATAVAAGIGAIMLSYAAVLPQFAPARERDEALRIFRRMRDSRGMTAMFQAMAEDKSGGRKFVNPAQFWLRKNKDGPRYHAIFDCLWEVDRTM